MFSSFIISKFILFHHHRALHQLSLFCLRFDSIELLAVKPIATQTASWNMLRKPILDLREHSKHFEPLYFVRVCAPSPLQQDPHFSLMICSESLDHF